jgi:hypothetical protein
MTNRELDVEWRVFGDRALTSVVAVRAQLIGRATSLVGLGLRLGGSRCGRVLARSDCEFRGG